MRLCGIHRNVKRQYQFKRHRHHKSTSSSRVSLSGGYFRNNIISIGRRSFLNSWFVASWIMVVGWMLLLLRLINDLRQPIASVQPSIRRHLLTAFVRWSKSLWPTTAQNANSLVKKKIRWRWWVCDGKETRHDIRSGGCGKEERLRRWMVERNESHRG